jgi:beta-lactamase class A
VPRPKLRRTSVLVAGAALVAAASASAGFDETLAAAERGLVLPRTPEGMQARYDAGRNLEEAVFSQRSPRVACRLRASLVLAHGLVREAEGYDRPLGRLEGAGRRQASIGLARVRACPSSGDRIVLRRGLVRSSALPPLGKAAPERAEDVALSARLASLGRGFPGWSAIWVHDPVTGRIARWNSDAQFPAASTVKLGVLLAALRRVRDPARSPLDYDLHAMTRWSSNLAANRLFTRVGGRPAVEGALRRVGATRSTYPQGYRVGTTVQALDIEKPPPLVTGRVTTAHDLGRILYALHAGALGNGPALRLSGLDPARCRYGLSLLLAAQPTGNNAGLLRPWLPGTPIAQKNGWLHDARHTAAIVYGRKGPRIVVVLTYAPNLRLATARGLGRDVLAALR